MGDGTESRSSGGWTENSLGHDEGHSHVLRFRMGRQAAKMVLMFKLCSAGASNSDDVGIGLRKPFPSSRSSRNTSHHHVGNVCAAPDIVESKFISIQVFRFIVPSIVFLSQRSTIAGHIAADTVSVKKIFRKLQTPRRLPPRCPGMTGEVVRPNSEALLPHRRLTFRAAS